MKRLLIVSFSFLLTYSITYSQGNIVKSNFQEKGFNLEVRYVEKQKTQFETNNLLINIIPIDPTSLNDEMAKSAYLKGQYKYTFIDRTRQAYFLTKKVSHQKTASEMSLESGLDWLLENNIINESDYNKLVEEILDNSNVQNSDNQQFNPYFFGSGFLSTYKITFNNNTALPISFRDNISVISGGNILFPLSDNELSTLLQGSNALNSFKISNIFRYNLDSNFVIPANSICTKYFATVPINFEENSFEIVLNSKNPQKSIYAIDKNKQDINNSFTYYELIIYPNSWFYENVYTIIRNSDASSFVGGKILYVDENDLSKEISIFVLATYQGKVYYCPLKFTPKTYLDFEKKKRLPLPVQLIQIKTL